MYSESNTLKDTYAQTIEAINHNAEILTSGIEMLDAGNTTYQNFIYPKVIEICFVEMLNILENFIEKAFINLLIENKDLNNNIYKCYTKPKDYEHAYRILKGRSTFPKWLEVKEICLLTDLYFENNGPFKRLCENPAELQEIKNIRNYIVHKSTSARENYKKVLYKYTRNYTLKPSEFLLDFYQKDTTYYSFYESFIISIIDSICYGT